MPNLVKFPQPDIIMYEKTLSTSGQFLIFYGQHFEKGHSCWVVGSSNKASGEIVMRHYNDQIPGCVSPKAQAVQFWEEFRARMTERKEHGNYEEDDASDEIRHLLTSH